MNSTLMLYVPFATSIAKLPSISVTPPVTLLGSLTLVILTVAYSNGTFKSLSMTLPVTV